MCLYFEGYVYAYAIYWSLSIMVTIQMYFSNLQSDVVYCIKTEWPNKNHLVAATPVLGWTEYPNK